MYPVLLLHVPKELLNYCQFRGLAIIWKALHKNFPIGLLQDAGLSNNL